jgi:hypothetical protein
MAPKVVRNPSQMGSFASSVVFAQAKTLQLQLRE